MKRLYGLVLGVITIGACARTMVPASSSALVPGAMPAAYRGAIAVGEFVSPLRILRENAGRLEIVDSLGHLRGALGEGPVAGERCATPAISCTWKVTSDGVSLVGPDGAFSFNPALPRTGVAQLQVTPVRSVEELRPIALAATPPRESGDFLPSDLVELVRLDPTIKLDVRYATTNNFLGTRFYDEGRAFLQRPAAEAVVRANAALRPLGYGILVHDGYRPWYVTKMFWDATPTEKRWLVADPAQGSKHNRGAAVDLTLYDLKTGAVIEMPSTYDESTDRAYYDYPGGTSRQRWHRELLHNAMVAQGFIQNPREWWHYDHRDWRRYPIGNVKFSEIR